MLDIIASFCSWQRWFCC